MKKDFIFIMAVIIGISAFIILIKRVIIKSYTMESNWKPEYSDPKKLKLSMMGMASEGNSVGGMIANPKFGAMVHS